MPENMHPEQNSRAAAEPRQYVNYVFRNAQSASAGCRLVYTEKDKADGIYRNKVSVDCMERRERGNGGIEQRYAKK